MSSKISISYREYLKNKSVTNYVNPLKQPLRKIRNGTAKKCKCGKIIEDRYEQCYNCCRERQYGVIKQNDI